MCLVKMLRTAIRPGTSRCCERSRDGRAGLILDNLIAQKKAVPMLIGMPALPPPGLRPLSGLRHLPQPEHRAVEPSYEPLTRDLLEDIIPCIAKELPHDRKS